MKKWISTGLILTMFLGNTCTAFGYEYGAYIAGQQGAIKYDGSYASGNNSAINTDVSASEAAKMIAYLTVKCL